MITIIAYILTLACVFFAITAIPNMIIGGFLGRLSSNPLIGSLLGGVIIWVFIDFLWIVSTANHIPVLVFILSFLILTFHSYSENENLNTNAKYMIAAEQWALVLVCIYTMVSAENIRWF